MADINVPFTLYLQGIEGTEAFKRISESIRKEVAAGMRFAAAETRQPRDARGRFASRGSAGTYGSYDKDIKGAEKLNQVTAEYVRAVRSFGGENSYTKGIYDALPARAKKAADALGIVQTKITGLLREAKNGKDVGKELGALFAYIEKPAIKKNSAIGNLAFQELKTARQELEAIEKAKTKASTDAQKAKDKIDKRFERDSYAGTELVRSRTTAYNIKKQKKDEADAARLQRDSEKELNRVLAEQLRIREFLAKRQFQKARGGNTDAINQLKAFSEADPAVLVQQRLSGRGNGRGGNRGVTTGGSNSPDDPEKIRRLFLHAKALDANARAAHNAGISAERFGELAGLALKRYGAFLVGTFALTQVLQGISQATAEFYNFEKAFTVLEQVLDTSESKFLSLQKTITTVAVTTGVSATEITKGLGTLAQAGFGNADELEKIASVLAKITLAPSFDDIPSTIEGLIAIFGQFNLKLTDTQSILDKVNKLSVDYAIESRDFFEAVKRGGATFATAGGSFEEFASLLTLLRSSTRETASTLGIFFKSGLTKFNRPSSQALVETIIGKDAGKNLTILEQFTKLAPKFAELSGGEQIQLSNQLVGVQQSARLIKLLQEINKESAAGKNTANSLANATGSIDASVAIRLDDVGVSMNRIREAFGKFIIELGKTDEVKNFASSLADIAQSLAGMTKEVAAAIPYISALVGFLAFKQIGGFAGGLISELRGVAGSATAAGVLGNQATKSGILGLPTPSGIGRSAGKGLRSLRGAGGLASSGIAAGGLFLAAGGGDLFTDSERKQRKLQTTGFGLSGGAAIGSVFGPVGAAIGGVVGGTAGFVTAQNTARKEDEKFKRDKQIADRQKLALENISKVINPNKDPSFITKNNLEVARRVLQNNPNATSKDVTEAINTDNLAVINNTIRKEFSNEIRDAVQPFKNATSQVSGSKFLSSFGSITGGVSSESLAPGFGDAVTAQNLSFTKSREALKKLFESIKGTTEALQQQFPDVNDGQSNALITKNNIIDQLNADVKEFFDQTLFGPGFIDKIKTGLIGVSEEILKINEEYRRISNVIANISVDPSSTRSLVSGNVTNRDLVSSIVGTDVLRDLTESFIRDTTKLLANSDVNLLKELRDFGVTGLGEDGTPTEGSLTNSIIKTLENPEQRKLINKLTTIFPNQDQASVFSALSQLDENTIRPFIEKQVGIASRDEKFGEALRNYADQLSAQATKLRELNDALDQTSSAMADLRLSSTINRSDSLLRRQDVRNIINPSSDAGSQRAALLRNITGTVGSGVNLAALGKQAVDAANVRNTLALQNDAAIQQRGGIGSESLVNATNQSQIAANRSLVAFDVAVKQIQASLGYATQAVDAYGQATNELRNSLQQAGSSLIGTNRTDFNKGTTLIRQFQDAGGFDFGGAFDTFKKANPTDQKRLLETLDQTPDAVGRIDATGKITTFKEIADEIRKLAGINLTDQRSGVKGNQQGVDTSAAGRLRQLGLDTESALKSQLKIFTDLRDAEESRVKILQSQQDFLQSNTSALLAVTPSMDALVYQMKTLNENFTKKADLGGGVGPAPNLTVGGVVDINFNVTTDQAMTAIRPMLTKAIGVEISKLGKLFESNDPDLASRIQAQAQTIHTQ